MLEYTPGMRAPSSAEGNFSNQRSGFHSYTSSPQRSRLVLQPVKCNSSMVPFGTGTSVTTEPSRVRIGLRRGSVVSFAALPNSRWLASIADGDRTVAYSRGMNWPGA